MKGLLENMDQQHAQILKQLRSGQGDKKNKSKQVAQPVPRKQHPLPVLLRCCALHRSVKLRVEARVFYVHIIGQCGVAKHGMLVLRLSEGKQVSAGRMQGQAGE